MALLDIGSGFWELRRQMETLLGVRLTDVALQQAGARGGASFARAFAGGVQPDQAARAFRDCVAAYQAAGFGRFEVELLEWPLGRVLIQGSDPFESWMMRQHGQEAQSPVCSYTAGVLVGFVNVLSDRRDIVCVEHTCQSCGGDVCRFELLPLEQAADVPAVAFHPDPLLGQHLNLLEILFERMPMGIAIFDRAYELRRCNLTWREMVDRFTPSSWNEIIPGKMWSDLIPDTEGQIKPVFDRVLGGETLQQEALRLESGGMVSYWDMVWSPLSEDDTVIGAVVVQANVTDRVLAQQELTQTLEHLRESEANLRALMESARGFVIYRVAIDQARPRKGRIILVSPSAREVIGLADPYDFESWFSGVHEEDLPRVVEANQRSVEEGVPYDQTARWYHALRKEWIWVRTISSPVLDRDGQVAYFNGIILDITAQREAQIELREAYETLERRVEERTREIELRRQVAEGLRSIVGVLNSSLSLDETLRFIVEQIARLLVSDACLIFRFDEDHTWMTLVSSYGLPVEYQELGGGPVFPTPIIAAILDRRPAAIPDIPAYADAEKAVQREPLGDFHQKWFGLASRHYRSVLGVPLVVGDQLYGGLIIYFGERRDFDDEDYRLGIALGDQVALAIESAQLHVQVEQIAVMRERQRLARELHDSVTQSLYSLTLLAEAGGRLAQANDLGRVKEHLARLGEISQQALKEMRLLVYQLGPLDLKDEGLVSALRKRLGAVERRAGVDARLLLDSETVSLPAALEEAFFRVAQEALNNALKHAAADSVTVCLRTEGPHIELEVIDNGKGFNLDETVDLGGMGLSTMRERAERLGASFTVSSAPGEGTSVLISIAKGLAKSLSHNGVTP